MRDKGQELEKALIGKKKILVIGPNASGKSTLSKTLGERFSLDVCHLDRLYWSENWKAVDNDLLLIGCRKYYNLRKHALLMVITSSILRVG